MRVTTLWLFVGATNIAQADILMNNNQLSSNDGLYDISQDLGQTIGKVFYLEQVTVWGKTVCVEAKKLGEEGFIIVLAAKKNDIIKAYKLRWNFAAIIA
ncbi:hypothetical protein [Candidatus Albibeggiatoa sp. nov. BB20]|uniref:hypothetical protein n=1 Tax=Candidatus Albibeggiatoa sp. nov. BB20 TaxID=3162723 RepID=UPI0033659B07